MKTWRVIIADDHQMFLDGIRMVLETTGRYEVVAGANSGTGVLHALEHNEAEIVVLDINMSGLDGVETARIIRETHRHVRILMLTMLSHDSFIKRLMRAGVDGYILKENGQRELVAALDAIASGKKYFSPEVCQAVMNSFDPAVQNSGLNRVKLTDRELEVLRMVAREMTTEEIADKLFVARSTVISHRKNIMRKLDVRNAAGMVRFATEMGLLG